MHRSVTKTKWYDHDFKMEEREAAAFDYDYHMLCRECGDDLHYDEAADAWVCVCNGEGR